MSNDKALQRAAKRVRDLIYQRQFVKADLECDEGLRRFRGAAVFLSLKAVVAENRFGIEAALRLHDQAAAAAPGDPVIVEGYAVCLDRAMMGERACGVRFSLVERGIHHPPSLVQLAWQLLLVDGTLTAGNRVYAPHDFYRMAMAAHDRPMEVAQSIGITLAKAKRAQQATPVLKDALAFDPANADGWRIYFSMRGGRTSPEAALERAIRINNDPRSRMIHALRIDGAQPSRAAMLAERARVERELDALLADRHFRIPIVNIEAESPYVLFYFAYHGEDDRPLMEKTAAVFRHGDPALSWTAPHARKPRDPAKPLRIGFVGSFGTLSIQLQIMYVIGTLANRGYEINVYTIDRVRGEEVYDVAGIEVKLLPLHIARAREIIAAGENDIIFFTDLFMNSIYYFLAFAKLGRRQLLWTGHPVTSGLDTIDYAISAIPNERPGAEVDFTEGLALMPELVVLYPEIAPEYTDVAMSEFGVPPDRPLYMCVQTLYKLHPDFDDAIRQILLTDPQGIMLLFENAFPEHTKSIGPRIDALKAEFGERLLMLPRLPLPRYLGLLSHVDVLLDTFHFSGGNTSLQAIQMGIPVVTLPGRYTRGRSTVGLYQVMGFEELVARDQDDYVRIAVKVANDREYRAYCRQMIAERRQRLFGQLQVVDDYIRLFHKLFEPETVGKKLLLVDRAADAIDQQVA